MIEEKVAPWVRVSTSFDVYFLGVDTTYIMFVLIPSSRRAEENYKDSAPCTAKVGPDVDHKKAERRMTYLVWKRTTKSSCHSSGSTRQRAHLRLYAPKSAHTGLRAIEHTYEGAHPDLPVIGHLKKYEMPVHFSPPPLHSIRIGIV